MIDDIILKGNGVLVQGQHAEDMGGQYLAMSPSQMMDRYHAAMVGGDKGTLTHNPFHIDPRTGRPLNPRQGYDLRNIYEALVEGMYHHLTKKVGPMDPEATKRTLREYVNKAAEMFNKANLQQNPRTKNLYPHEKGMRGYGKYQEGTGHVFTDVNRGTINPELMKNLNVYVPEYQKIGSLGNHAEPHNIRIKNSKGQYVTLNHSMQDHQNWGHMSEGGFFGAIMQYLGLVANHWNLSADELPHTMNRGYIKPEEFVIHTDPNGLRSNFWKYWGANEDPNEGTNPIPDQSKKHPHISLRSALGSLWEGFFQPAIHPAKVGDERRDYARQILTRVGQVPPGMVSDRDVENFSRSILMQILEDSRAGNNTLRSASQTFHWYNKMRKAAGLPQWSRAPVGKEEMFLPREMDDALRHANRKYNVNVNHMKIGNHMGRSERGNSHSAANKTLRQGLLLSMYLEQRPEQKRQAIRDLNTMPYSLQDNMAEGSRLKQLFMRMHHDEPSVRAADFARHPSEDGWIDPQGIEPKGNIQPRAQNLGAWESPSMLSYLPQMRVPMASWRMPRMELPIPPPYRQRERVDDDEIVTSDDSLYDLMESLQSADARMDDVVMKALPAERRYDILVSRDMDILCSHYQLSKSDIHYIQQSLGDWTEIAERLKVEPYVVKSVKVALRW